MRSEKTSDIESNDERILVPAPVGFDSNGVFGFFPELAPKKTADTFLVKSAKIQNRTKIKFIRGIEFFMNPKKKHTVILMADDDPDDCLIVENAFQETFLGAQFRFVHDGTQLMDYLRRNGRYADTAHFPIPDIVLLDLNMPLKDGREALEEIKSDPRLRIIPIVVLTTSKGAEDIRKSYELGASSFITKPSDFHGFVTLAHALEKYWFEVATLPPKS